jgi:hypothetical protein
VQAFAPLNLGAFLREWEAGLAPDRALTHAAHEFLREDDWLVGDRFTLPTFQSQTLLGKSSHDASLIEIFEGSDCLVSYRDESRPIRELPDDEAGLSECLPMLLGLAVCSTVLVPVGLAGRWLADKYQDMTQQREELRAITRKRITAEREAAISEENWRRYRERDEGD